ncbi:uncharacterized protein YALI1_C14843g [Yarrowia lipolytica]|uniref:Major facilitator superfamily (MFS) profile domain-containing protein n=1 Tax=Yarrowia lipolytica TaxID=4952 RepID=A0A1D8NAI5_YARLL|nr:hypothetical protein YALI1_C14843g [Yarrowia lipolytica]
MANSFPGWSTHWPNHGSSGVCHLTDKYGCKKVKLIPLILLSAVVFLVFFATNKSMLCAGWTISGLIWGVFNTMTPTYVPEICPVSLRSTFAAAINLSWVIGQLLAIAVITGPEPKPNDWPYPIPMAMQWVFPAVLIPIILFMSESSWWTLKQDDEQGSRKTLEQVVDKMSTLTPTSSKCGRQSRRKTTRESFPTASEEPISDEQKSVVSATHSSLCVDCTCCPTLPTF